MDNSANYTLMENVFFLNVSTFPINISQYKCIFVYRQIGLIFCGKDNQNYEE